MITNYSPFSPSLLIGHRCFALVVAGALVCLLVYLVRSIHLDSSNYDIRNSPTPVARKPWTSLPRLTFKFIKMKNITNLFRVCTSDSRIHFQFRLSETICSPSLSLYAKIQGDKFRLMIAHTLRDDGYPADDNEWNPLEQNSRADAFEYVMHGKIYRIDGDDGPNDASRL